jgi:chitinase
MARNIVAYIAASDPGVYSTKVTHWMMAIANLTSSAGALTVDGGWDTCIAGIRAANPTKPVILSIGGSDANYTAMVANAGYRSTFISNIQSAISTYGFDGVSIDWEYPSNTTDGNNLVTLLSEIRTAIGSEASLSYAAGNFDTFLTYVNAVNTFQYADFAMLMGYDYNWSTLGHHSQLYVSEIFATENNITYQISGDNMVQLWKDTVGSDYYDKIILGCPFYGYYYENSHQLISYSDLLSTYIDLNDWYSNYDSVAQVPWLEKWISGDTYHHIFYENGTSIAAKANYVINENIAGLGIWLTEYDSSSALLTAMSNVFDAEPGGGGEGGGETYTEAVLGDYTPENWVNTVSKANATTMKKITDQIYVNDQNAVKAFHINYFDERDYFYMKCMKVIDYFNSGWSARGSYTTLSNDTTNFYLFDKAQRMTRIGTASTDYVAIEKSVSLNLAQFSGADSVSNTNDFIVICFKVVNKANFDYFRIRLGADYVNCYYQDLDIDGNGNITDDRWYCWSLKKSDFSSTGSGHSWSDIQYIGLLGYNYASSSGAYIVIQYMYMARVDSVLSSYYNVFQKYNGQEWSYKFYPNLDHYTTVIDSTAGFVSPGIVHSNPNAYSSRQLFLKSDLKQFFAKLYICCKYANYLPSFTLYQDSDNYIMCQVENGVAGIYKRQNGSGTWYPSNESATIAVQSKAQYYIEKDNDVLRFRIKGTASQIILELDVSGFTNTWDLYIGGASIYSGYGVIYEIQISNTNISPFNSVALDIG